MGLIISTSEAFLIQVNRCAKKDFFTGLKGIWMVQKVSLQNLIVHYQSSGNLSNIENGLLALQTKNKNIEISVLFAFDLAGKNLKSEIEDSERELKLEFSHIKNEHLEVNLIASYKLNFPESIYMKNEIPIVEKKIQKKLETFLETWPSLNPTETEFFIRKNIIPMSVDGIHFISQEYKITSVNTSSYEKQ